MPIGTKHCKLNWRLFDLDTLKGWWSRCVGGRAHHDAWRVSRSIAWSRCSWLWVATTRKSAGMSSSTRELEPAARARRARGHVHEERAVRAQRARGHVSEELDVWTMCGWLDLKQLPIPMNNCIKNDLTPTRVAQSCFRLHVRCPGCSALYTNTLGVNINTEGRHVLQVFKYSTICIWFIVVACNGSAICVINISTSVNGLSLIDIKYIRSQGITHNNWSPVLYEISVITLCFQHYACINCMLCYTITITTQARVFS